MRPVTLGQVAYEAFFTEPRAMEYGHPDTVRAHWEAEQALRRAGWSPPERGL